MVFTDEKSTLVKVCFLVIEIISALGFMMFILSCITASVNIGSVTGALMSAAVFVLCIKHHKAAEFISGLAQTKGGKVLLTAAALLIIICLAAALVLSAFMIKHIERLPEKPCAVIVLGCRVRESGPSLMLSKRIDAAYEYLSENEDVICIASGGKGNDEPQSEASCIKDRLVQMGISPDRIYVEDRSESTVQNIENSMLILDELKLDKEAVIVTSEFHQLRAYLIARREGLEAYSTSSSTAFYLLPSYWIREWFGIMYELIR